MLQSGEAILPDCVLLTPTVSRVGTVGRVEAILLCHVMLAPTTADTIKQAYSPTTPHATYKGGPKWAGVLSTPQACRSTSPYLEGDALLLIHHEDAAQQVPELRAECAHVLRKEGVRLVPGHVLHLLNARLQGNQDRMSCCLHDSCCGVYQGVGRVGRSSRVSSCRLGMGKRLVMFCTK